MRNEINISDLIVFSDGLKVLVMGVYQYEKETYLLVRRVNEAETITEGNSFFLKVLSEPDNIECVFVDDEETVLSLMNLVKNYCKDE